jgi:hypothetical protein
LGRLLACGPFFSLALLAIILLNDYRLSLRLLSHLRLIGLLLSPSALFDFARLTLGLDLRRRLANYSRAALLPQALLACSLFSFALLAVSACRLRGLLNDALIVLRLRALLADGAFFGFALLARLRGSLRGLLCINGLTLLALNLFLRLALLARLIHARSGFLNSLPWCYLPLIRSKLSLLALQPLNLLPCSPVLYRSSSNLLASLLRNA